jgi:hypothetical protein
MVLTEPKSITELSVFLLPGARLPEGKGLSIYFSVPGSVSWTALGALWPAQQSAVFRPSFASTPEIASAPAVHLGIALESAAEVINLVQATSSKEFDKLGFAHYVARDIFTYLQSFSRVEAGGERIVLPSDALDRWLKRFEERYRRDPNFMLHSTK